MRLRAQPRRAAAASALRSREAGGENSALAVLSETGARPPPQVHPSAPALRRAAQQLFVTVVNAALARKGSAVVALSGGSAGESLAGLSTSTAVDWSRVHVFLADERCLPAGHADCNATALRAGALAGAPPATLHTLPTGAPADAAAAYEAALTALPAAVLPRSADGLPVFDLVVLGVGPDGHVASLFANRTVLAPTPRSYLPVTDSPKPPAARVTLSLSAINAAATVVVLASSAAKAEVVQRALEVQALPGALPAQSVRPAPPGELVWLLDVDSASALSTAEWAKPSRWPRSEVPAPPAAA